MKKRAIFTIVFMVALMCVAPFAFAQKTKGEAGIGFLAISSPLVDTLSAFSVSDMLYGVTVNYAVRPWLGVSTDVLYLGDLYYGSGSGSFTEGPLPWSSITTNSGNKADWKYYESFIYAPLSINLMLPLGIVRPYLGLGPAFYFHISVDEPGSYLYRLPRLALRQRECHRPYRAGAHGARRLRCLFG